MMPECHDDGLNVQLLLAVDGSMREPATVRIPESPPGPT